jgi:Na+/phosphate symporter
MQLAQALAKLCQVLLSRLIVSFVVTMVVAVVILAVIMLMMSVVWQYAHLSIALNLVPSLVCCPLTEFLTAPKSGLYKQKQR